MKDKIVKAIGNSGHVMIPKEHIGKKVSIRVVDVGNAYMEMQEQIEVDILNPPKPIWIVDLFRDRDFKKEFMIKSIENVELVDDATDYYGFLDKTLGMWEKQILKYADEFLRDEVVTEKAWNMSTKSFGQFLMSLFNSVNTKSFRDNIKKVIRVNFKRGLENAEEELGVDVGFDSDFDQKLGTLADRQIEGFMIDGKRWKGLKGVSADVQDEISQLVSTGIGERESLVEIKNKIKQVMIKYKGGEVNGEVTEGRVMKIARTESSRFTHEAKMDAFKKSGLKGKKEWVALLDERTGPQSKRLNGQKRELDELFVDPLTGEQFMYPPHRPNDRCTFKFVPLE